MTYVTRILDSEWDQWFKPIHDDHIIINT